MINWQVRSVSSSTVAEIKKQAQSRGLSIGQYLDWHFTKDVEVGYDSSQGNKEYKLSLSTKAMNVLKKLAAESGYGVSKYLEEVLAKPK